MNTPTKFFGLLALVGLMLFSSCRKSEDEYTPPDHDGSVAIGQQVNTLA